MLQIKISWKGTCPHHPRYNPENDGEGGVKGRCEFCFLLSDEAFPSA